MKPRPPFSSLSGELPRVGGRAPRLLRPPAVGVARRVREPARDRGRAVPARRRRRRVRAVGVRARALVRRGVPAPGSPPSRASWRARRRARELPDEQRHARRRGGRAAVLPTTSRASRPRPAAARLGHRRARGESARRCRPTSPSTCGSSTSRSQPRRRARKLHADGRRRVGRDPAPPACRVAAMGAARDADPSIRRPNARAIGVSWYLLRVAAPARSSRRVFARVRTPPRGSGSRRKRPSARSRVGHFGAPAASRPAVSGCASRANFHRAARAARAPPFLARAALERGLGRARARSLPDPRSSARARAGDPACARPRAPRARARPRARRPRRALRAPAARAARPRARRRASPSPTRTRPGARPRAHPRHARARRVASTDARLSTFRRGSPRRAASSREHAVVPDERRRTRWGVPALIPGARAAARARAPVVLGAQLGRRRRTARRARSWSSRSASIFASDCGSCASSLALALGPCRARGRRVASPRAAFASASIAARASASTSSFADVAPSSASTSRAVGTSRAAATPETLRLAGSTRSRVSFSLAARGRAPSPPRAAARPPRRACAAPR